ncbi:MAG: Peptidoglycan D,D-transpeptidase MrdA [Cellvibrionales bacterium UBA7375]|nr:penicillin-binding protein 2 [Porticoccaceae bacterium]RPG83577.1 MAG: penicillin-binding protein 2 [Cellvibrionales bacterium TMED47]CAI8299906.1 MAG: Peptidoglycan D,D-transpeptidase MrdA [Cellvibrionales bacterium UBA7375]
MMRDIAISDRQQEQRIFSTRVLLSLCIVLGLTSVVLYRYFDLQINRHLDYVTNSNKNRIHIRSIAPTRGLIFDRHGQLLADNRPAFTLNIIPDRTQNTDSLVAQLGLLLSISDKDIARFEKHAKRSKGFAPVPLKYNLTEEERAILAVNSHLLAGTEVSAQLMRFYPQRELLTHTLGYVGRINDREIRTIDPENYRGTDFIGKIGLEKYYEETLLGKVGTEQVETDARGRVMRVLDKKDPVSGSNLTIHIDSQLQRVALDALKNERGALVAIDVKTGGILSMVSTPSYDPNLFTSGISQKQYDGLLKSPDRPLFNRALRGQYPPGSTVKPLFGLIGLQHKIFDLDYSINDPGYFFMEGIKRPWRDHNADQGGHGQGVDLAEAIIESCDVFFYTTGVKAGIDLLSKESALFGLGDITGIDLPGEKRGIMPSRDWKKENRRQDWFNGDTINMSIGQGFMLTTPLQLAVMSARIAARGKTVVPKLLKSINGEEIEPEYAPDQIEYDDRYWDYIHKAMIDVVHSDRGTARGISKGLNYKLAGKTGTAQVISIHEKEKYDSSKIDKRKWDHALFVAFAPADNPKVALGLIVENGEHGSRTAAPIARKVIDRYLSDYLQKSPNNDALRLAKYSSASIKDN